jgi:hypothetical protein
MKLQVPTRKKKYNIRKMPWCGLEAPLPRLWFMKHARMMPVILSGRAASTRIAITLR